MIGNPERKKNDAFIEMTSDGLLIFVISSLMSLRVNTFFTLVEKKSKNPDCNIKTNNPMKR